MKTRGTSNRSDDLIASYSSKGPTLIDHIAKPDLVAPGNKVVSNIGKGGHTLAQEYPQNIVTGSYFRLSGTSMATPVVSGAAALLLQQTPSLTPDEVKARLMKTASKSFPVSSVAVDSEHWNFVYELQYLHDRRRLCGCVGRVEQFRSSAHGQDGYLAQRHVQFNQREGLFSGRDVGRLGRQRGLGRQCGLRRLHRQRLQCRLGR